MPVSEPGVITEFKAEGLIKCNRPARVADSNTDVIGALDIKHHLFLRYYGLQEPNLTCLQ
jgi:hypothetical protein